MFICFTFYLPLIDLRCSTLRVVFFRACNLIVLLVKHSNEAQRRKYFHVSKKLPISANFLDSSTSAEIPTSCRHFYRIARATYAGVVKNL